MAYSKVVIWPAPFDTQKLPAGRYGMKYTYVECDIPQFEFSRELWELSNVFIGFGENQEETVFYTSTYYRKATLKAFANGIEIPALEDTKRKKRVVKLKTADIQNKDIYFKYVPGEFGESIGDQKDRLEGLYGIRCTVRYNSSLRENLHLARDYINHMAEAIEVEPPLWVGGIGNQDVGEINNILPKLTPIEVDLHLKPLKAMTDLFSKFLLSRNYSDIGAVPEPAYTIEYMEAIQRILIELDNGFKKVLG
jgi:hypothetical protein